MRGKKWFVHYCPRDRKCKRYPPVMKRLSLGTPLGVLHIAIRRNDWSQVWLPWKKREPILRYPTNYRAYRLPVVYHPLHKCGKF